MDVLIFSLNAIAPVVLLIVVGYFLRKKEILNDNFVVIGNKFCFTIALPSLVFVNVYSIKSIDHIRWDFVGYSIAIVLFLVLIGFIVACLFVKDPKQKGVVLQCFYRSNFAIIGIPLAQSLVGDEATVLASLALAFLIPTFNVLAVISLSVFAHPDKKISIKALVLKILSNPLIIGVVLGLVCIVLRSFLPVRQDGTTFSLKTCSFSFIYKSIENVSKIVSPFALIILGAQFKFASIKKMIKQIIISTVGRIIMAPLIAIGIALLFIPSFGKYEYAVLIALFGSPVAVSSAIMAAQMDNDGELAGQLVVWTSVFSAFTIFIIVALFRHYGIF